MEDNKLTQEMKGHGVIVAIHAKHSDLEILLFFNVSRSFVHKIRRGLEASVESVAKRRKHKLRSDAVRTPQLLQQVQGIIDEDPSKTIRAILRDLQVSECTIRRTVYEEIRYKSYVMCRGQFMSAQTQEQ